MTSQTEEWNDALRSVGGADIYYSPGYCAMAENNNEGMARLFVYREQQFIICYAFLMRSINDLNLPEVKQLQRNMYDIVTPYGYGGPLCNVKDEEERVSLFERFGEVFSAYCRMVGIVTEFVRFHPLFHNEKDYSGVQPTPLRNTVCMDLTSSREDVIDSLTSGCRNRVRYAQKNGVRVSREDPAQIKDFIELYYATMDKNHAHPYYYFSEPYFRDLVQLLDQHVSLFVARYEGRVIASTFFLHYNDYVTYHLTGSDKDYLKFAPYNLLICEAASYFKSLGYKYLHLGGGYGGNDELFRFKSTFSKKAPLDFYIGRKVHNPEIYEMLTRQIQVQDNFFPLYRHSSLGVSTYSRV
ncbi:hypothetical protein SY83_08240 [Paenibacillus swuensis]|uniref:Lipid II:glycine glycyltransferase n=2 Tax=Paenibacillus swuensis TaxID=1178515 RepID=A0A172TPQ6_9BACL|nr:hypothetical protein SY83_08240 [Paenibacillus swuensis]